MYPATSGPGGPSARSTEGGPGGSLAVYAVMRIFSGPWPHLRTQCDQPLATASAAPGRERQFAGAATPAEVSPAGSPGGGTRFPATLALGAEGRTLSTHLSSTRRARPGRLVSMTIRVAVPSCSTVTRRALALGCVLRRLVLSRWLIVLRVHRSQLCVTTDICRRGQALVPPVACGCRGILFLCRR